MRAWFSTRPAALAIVALAILAPATAGAQAADAQQLLTVSGEGTVRAKPDMALITLGVVTQAKAARDALTQNTQSMTRILDALKSGGMDPRDLQTSGFSVDPVYSQQPRNNDGSEPFSPEIVGYRVGNNLTLRIRDLDRVGTILDQVVTLGANSISGPTFTVAEPAPFEDQARRAAVRDAVRKGKLYADALEVALGPLARVDEGYLRAPQPLSGQVMMRMDAAAAPPVPIEAGELTFEAQVSVSWEIDQ